MSRENYGLVSALQTATTGEPVVGTVIRRTCAVVEKMETGDTEGDRVVGSLACAKTCQLAALHGLASAETIDPQTERAVMAGKLNPDTILEDEPHACPDNNLLRVIEGVGARPERTLMVGVGAAAADKVGFLGDILASPEARDALKNNPHGWNEIAGYNAFFMSEADVLPGSDGPVEMEGDRLADSAQAFVELVDRRGDQPVPAWGLIHITRTNMLGRNHRTQFGGQTQGFTQFAVDSAMRQFGSQPDDVKLHLIAAVGPESWRKQYANRAKMETYLPGWDEEGLIAVPAKPGYQAGDDITDPATGRTHWLHPNYPQKALNELTDAAEALGIPRENVTNQGTLDPGMPWGDMVHSSANSSRVANQDGRVPAKDGRDVYAIVRTPRL
jgi:hypothetical protein